MRSALAVLVGLSLVSSSARAATPYPAGIRHSPFSAEIIARLQAVVAKGGGRRDVFVKIGDSITVHPGFLGCFATVDETDLAGRADLADTVAFFSRTSADGTHLSWDRKSKAAHIGWSTFGALGTTAYSPLREEIRAVRPAFAVVMMGTNEVHGGGVGNYRHNLRRLVQSVLGEGVVPIVSTIPPRGDSADLDAVVRRMNGVVREIAEAEQVPLVDYEGELRRLPKLGLGPDGIHPLPRPGRACALSGEALLYGLNVRNLITLEALDRARRFLFDSARPEG